MLREVAVVEGVAEEKAQVRIKRHSACAHCEGRDSCHVFDGKDMVLEIRNDLHARTGDRVEITVPTRSLLKLTLLVYFFPVLALIVGAFLGNHWGPSLGTGPATGSVLGGSVAMAVAFFGLRRVDRAARSKSEYQPRMRRILERAPEARP
ncbi:MAG: SoxR reducing system RseC family protein [Deltaproteobacteria bacterium]|nr:SoxR reducing system RseC family protein [Deltaproteobacteria bacterium]